MSVDFEKIRLDCANDFKSKVVRNDGNDPYSEMIDIFVDLSSNISKQMLIKYHETLNSTKD